ncbi:MAG: hypothetical protein AAB401_21265, partial [Acidobacteriota bacterium]
MKRRTSSPDQPKLVLIYSALTIGFVFLLTLVWLIGSRSVTELQAISNLANDISVDYQNRLSMAGKIREEEVNVIAQARMVRATSQLPVAVPPFVITLNVAKQSFDKTLAEAKALWETRSSLQTLKPSELAAWREVEAAALEFLKSIQNLAPVNEEGSKPGTEGSVNTDSESAATPVEPKFNSEAFLQTRKRLDEAVTRLSNEIIADQAVFLTRIATQQSVAASEVSRTRWYAFIVGLFVAVAVFMITRSRILELRQAISSAQAAQDFARSVFDSQSNDILVMAENGEMLTINQAFFKRYHLRPSELLLQDYRGALAHLPEVAMYIRNTLQLSTQLGDNSEQSDNKVGKNATHRERIEVKTKRGPRQSQGFPAESRLYDVYVSPLTIDREARGRVVVLVDVTEEERVREELRRNRTLSAVGQITAQVAHELYNPIGAI